jgi:hypothetical protein
MRLYLPAIALLLIFGSSCEKQKPGVEGEIGIHLLSHQQTLDPLWEVDENTLTTEDIPLIRYEDILSYDPEKHIFRISSDAREGLKGQEMDLHNRAFAVKADEELIYTGYFWASFSSSICPWLTIDPIHAAYTGELRVELGYPGWMEEMRIPDRRNDRRVLDILRRDGKLVR